jgi:hypothetical protein
MRGLVWVGRDEEAEEGFPPVPVHQLFKFSLMLFFYDAFGRRYMVGGLKEFHKQWESRNFFIRGEYPKVPFQTRSEMMVPDVTHGKTISYFNDKLRI